MERTITQREIRNDNAEIMRALESGDTFIITRNGMPVGRLTLVGRLTPVGRRTFVPIADLKNPQRCRESTSRSFDLLSTSLSTKILRRVAEYTRGMLDAAVVIDISSIGDDDLSVEFSIAALTPTDAGGTHA